jgi:hypothetical protein
MFFNLLLLLPALASAAFYEKGKAFPSLQPPANQAAKLWAFSATPSCPDWAACGKFFYIQNKRSLL